jgi:hypothetical protein
MVRGDNLSTFVIYKSVIIPDEVIFDGEVPKLDLDVGAN